MSHLLRRAAIIRPWCSISRLSKIVKDFRVILYYSIYLLLVNVWFCCLSLVSSVLPKLRERLGRSSPKWPILCRVWYKTSRSCSSGPSFPSPLHVTSHWWRISLNLLSSVTWNTYTFSIPVCWRQRSVWYKTCVDPRSDEFECQDQRSKVKVTRDKNALC